MTPISITRWTDGPLSLITGPHPRASLHRAGHRSAAMGVPSTLGLAALLCLSRPIGAWAGTSCTNTNRRVVADETLKRSHSSVLYLTTAFVIVLGFTVGVDVTVSGIKRTITTQRRAFAVGVCCQFIAMPLCGFILSLVVPADHAFCSSSALSLAVLMPACLPGGTVSNLMTLLIGGNVELSIAMSYVSTVCALFMIPLNVLLYYETRFGGDHMSIKVPYSTILMSLTMSLCSVGVGMLIKARIDRAIVKRVQRVCIVLSILLLASSVIVGMVGPTERFEGHAATVIAVVLMYQPLGFALGMLFAVVSRLSWPDVLTVSIETGVQSFSLGMAIVQFTFDATSDTQLHAEFWRVMGGTAVASPFYNLFILVLFYCISRVRSAPKTPANSADAGGPETAPGGSDLSTEGIAPTATIDQWGP